MGGPHVAVNGNGSVNGQRVGRTGVLGAEQSAEIQPLSPLTSPLLTEAGYVRNDEEDEARRKVGIQRVRRWMGKFLVITELAPRRTSKEFSLD